MNRRLALLSLLVMAGLPAMAQVAESPLITSATDSNYRVVPDRVSFDVTTRFSKGSFEASYDSVSGLEASLVEALSKHKLEPLDVVAASPHISDLRDFAVSASVRLVFELETGIDRLENAKTVATLCDSVKQAAAEVNAEVNGPRLAVGDRKHHERLAVQLATENALTNAQSVAELMKTKIYEVENVRIDSVQWIETTGDREMAPTLDGVSCVVQIVVSYRHAP